MESRAAAQMLLAYGNWFATPKAFVRYYASFEVAGMLSYLINKSQHESRDDWFTCPVEMMVMDTCMSNKITKRLINRLSDDGSIDTRVVGLPPRRQFKLNWDHIIGVVCDPVNNAREMAIRTNLSESIQPEPATPIQPKRSDTCKPKRSESSDPPTEGPIKNRTKGKTVATASGSRRGDDGGFFSDGEDNTSPITEADKTHAKYLRDALTKTNKLSRPVSIKSWSDQFRQLRKFVEDPTIEKVLHWYGTNIRERGVPHAFSAKSFREKFDRIKARMEMTEEEVIEISDEAKAISKYLRMKSWPKGSGDDVPRVVQMCLNAYQAFRARRKALAKDTECPTKVRDFVKYVGGQLPSPEHFVEKWMTQVQADIVDWEGWSGNLASMAFRVDHKRFRHMGRAWANEYAQQPDLWDLMIKEFDAD